MQELQIEKPLEYGQVESENTSQVFHEVNNTSFEPLNIKIEDAKVEADEQFDHEELEEEEMPHVPAPVPKPNQPHLQVANSIITEDTVLNDTHEMPEHHSELSEEAKEPELPAESPAKTHQSSIQSFDTEMEAFNIATYLKTECENQVKEYKP